MIGRRRAHRPDDVCMCDHVRDAHEHYRPGTDCGVCGRPVCPEFRLAPAPTAAPADEVPPAVDATA